MIPELMNKADEIRRLPPRKAFREIVHALREIQKNQSWENTPESVRNFMTVVNFDGEVCNGGLAQYFTKPSGKNYLHVAEALTRFGINGPCEILERWLDILPRHINPADRLAVGQYIFSDKSRQAKSLDLDREYYSLRDTLIAKLIDVALPTPDQLHKMDS